VLVSLVHIASKPMSLQQHAASAQMHCQASRDLTWVLANADFGIEMPREQPEAWVGHKCKVFWPDDAEWYDAVVRAYDRSNGKHNVWYSYDQQVAYTSVPSAICIAAAILPSSCHQLCSIPKRLL